MRPIVPLNNQTPIDKIVSYLLHPDDKNYKLSDSLNEQLERMRTCAELIRQYGSSHEVTKILRSRYNISTSTAYGIYNDTQEVFGTTIKHNREYMVDHLIGMVTETRRKALAKNDLKTVAQCEKNMIDIIEKFVGEKEMIDWAKIQPPSIQIGFFPELSKVKLPDDWKELLDNMITKKQSSAYNIDHLQK